jgi:hypothetical protein
MPPTIRTCRVVMGCLPNGSNGMRCRHFR